MIKRLLGVLIAVMLLTAMVIPATAEVTTMYVRTNTGINLNVRSSPQVTKSNIIGSLKYGEAVGVDHYLGNGWAEIVYGAKRGYVATRYLVATKPTSKPSAKTATKTETKTDATILANMNAEFKSAKKVNAYTVYVNPTRVTTWINFRWAPSTSAKVISTYKAGDRFTVISELNHWLQVQDPATGFVGYIWKDMTLTAGN